MAQVCRFYGRIMVAQATVQTASTVMGPGLCSLCSSLGFYIAWGTSVSAGAITIETAAESDYSGTWAPLQIITYASGSPKVDFVQLNGVSGAVRCRITTGVTGGTVTITAAGN